MEEVLVGQLKLRVAAIIPAAGMSTRLGGRNKLLLEFQGKTLIEHAVDTLLESGVPEVVVVLGHQAEQVRQRLSGRAVTLVENPNYRQGLATSIQAGVRQISPHREALIIYLADQPLLTVADLQVLFQGFAEARSRGKGIVVPFYQGQRGNPVILDAGYAPLVLQIAGDVGCRRVIRENPDRVWAVEMPTDHVIRDIDTPEDYQRLTGSIF